MRVLWLEVQAAAQALLANIPYLPKAPWQALRLSHTTETRRAVPVTCATCTAMAGWEDVPARWPQGG